MQTIYSNIVLHSGYYCGVNDACACVCVRERERGRVCDTIRKKTGNTLYTSNTERSKWMWGVSGSDGALKGGVHLFGCLKINNLSPESMI